MQTIRKHKTLMMAACAILVLVAWISISYAAETTTKKYEYVVGPQKSDMQRMIEAYESLSTKYLTLVQQNLSLMAQQDQQILNKLSSMEKKIEQLNSKIDELQKELAKKQSTDLSKD